MGRKDKIDIATGVIVINKHQGVTSHRIVQILRRLYDTPRIGHTGTLDPMATGVLPILVGRAVKASDFVVASDKEYVAEMTLGLRTDTDDITGEVLERCENIPAEGEVVQAALSFIGDIEQIPPMYSAIKVGGRKLVDLAREGVTVERKTLPRTRQAACSAPLPSVPPLTFWTAQALLSTPVLTCWFWTLPTVTPRISCAVLSA